MIADIKTARLKAGLKRHEFARRVGVSAVAVWKWETGKTQPTDANWRAIEAVLRAKQTFNRACSGFGAAQIARMPQL